MDPGHEESMAETSGVDSTRIQRDEIAGNRILPELPNVRKMAYGSFTLYGTGISTETGTNEF